MTSLKWLEHLVCDVDTAIALWTMQFPQKDTMFVWCDTGVLDNQNKPVYRLMRRVELVDAPKQFMTGVFAAYTSEEFQSILPLNFMPMRMRPGLWCIVDAYGTQMKDQKDTAGGVETRQVIMARVSGSDAKQPAEAFGRAAIFLIQEGLLKMQ